MANLSNAELLKQATPVGPSAPASGEPSNAELLAGLPGQSLGASPPEYSGWDRPLSIIRNAAVHGVADLVGLASAANKVVNWSPFDLGRPSSPGGPTALEAQDWLGRHGALSSENVTPTGLGERLLAEGTEGVVSGAPMALLPGGMAAKAALVGESALGSALGGEAARLAPGNSLGQAALPMLAAGLPMAGATTVAEGLAGRAAARAATDAASAAAARAEAAADHLAATKALGQRQMLDLADAKAPALAQAAEIEQVAKADAAARITSSKALQASAIDAGNAQAQAMTLAAGKAREAVADAHSPGVSDFESGGKAAQAAMQSWISGVFPKLHEEAWAPVDAAVSPSAPVPLTKFKAALAGLETKAGVLQKAGEVFDPMSARARQISESLPKPEMGEDLESVAPAQEPTWADARAFRTQIGSSMGNPTVLRELPAQAKASLYRALTEDMRAAAGAEGSAAFDTANDKSKALFAFAEGPGARLLPAPVGTPDAGLAGKTASGMLNAAKRDGSDLAAIRANVPEAADHLAAMLLRAPGAPKWSELAPSAQSALVPDPIHQGMLHAADGWEAMAPQHAKSVAAEATAAHAEEIASAQADKATALARAAAIRESAGNALTVAGRVNARARLDAQDALSTAKAVAAEAAAKVPQQTPKTAPSDGPLTKASKLLMHVGEGALAGEGAQALGIPGANPLTVGLATGLAPLVLPPVGRALTAIPKSVLRRPGMTTAGMLGATNALFPEAGKGN